jgi:hypothetical protein
VTAPSKEEINELLRRLQTGSYSLPDIREAADILFSTMNNVEAYQFALDFSTSLHEQVRILGLCMMEKLSPHLESARGFLAGAQDAVKLLQSGSNSSKPAVPDYSAIGEVLKVWLRDSRKNRRAR